jgi:hypothetical protein
LHTTPVDDDCDDPALGRERSRLRIVQVAIEPTGVTPFMCRRLIEQALSSLLEAGEQVEEVVGPVYPLILNLQRGTNELVRGLHLGDFCNKIPELSCDRLGEPIWITKEHFDQILGIDTAPTVRENLP